MKTPAEAFDELVRIMARLRSPGGCPWDREQTHDSIKKYLIEETYEVIEGIESGDDEEFCAELGDLLLQVVFHAQMASERGAFAIADVLEAITSKLIRRHPHVFANTQVSGADEVLRNWSKIKSEERRHEEDSSAIAGVPRAMPALLRAHRLGEKAEHVQFDWADAPSVLEKVREEVDELGDALRGPDAQKARAEIGDLLFAITSLARHLGFNAEDALKEASDRFEKRFREMESLARQRGRDFRDLSAEEKDRLWQEVKKAS